MSTDSEPAATGGSIAQGNAKASKVYFLAGELQLHRHVWNGQWNMSESTRGVWLTCVLFSWGRRWSRRCSCKLVLLLLQAGLAGWLAKLMSHGRTTEDSSEGLLLLTTPHFKDQVRPACAAVLPKYGLPCTLPHSHFLVCCSTTFYLGLALVHLLQFYPPPRGSVFFLVFLALQ